VSRSLHRLACATLLAVLSGAPAVAVICAELCAPGAHHGELGRVEASCHGRSAGEAAIAGESAPDCGDHGAAAARAVASLVTGRDDDARIPPAEIAAPSFAASSAPGERLPSLASRASTPLPARSSRVLRI
jgi:hypothetical protein